MTSANATDADRVARVFERHGERKRVVALVGGKWHRVEVFAALVRSPVGRRRDRRAAALDAPLEAAAPGVDGAHEGVARLERRQLLLAQRHLPPRTAALPLGEGDGARALAQAADGVAALTADPSQCALVCSGPTATSTAVNRVPAAYWGPAADAIATDPDGLCGKKGSCKALAPGGVGRLRGLRDAGGLQTAPREAAHDR